METRHKILTVEALKKKIARAREEGLKIAFTNGCFDILHYGHVSYLQRAKTQNRVLVVGLNSDQSVRRIKGKDRPINGQKERAFVLAALQCVDFVTIFEEDTPLKLIEKIKPDILIKGADWKGKEVVGSEVVKKNGGKVEFVKYMSGYSTTSLIEKMQSPHPNPLPKGEGSFLNSSPLGRGLG